MKDLDEISPRAPRSRYIEPPHRTAFAECRRNAILRMRRSGTPMARRPEALPARKRPRGASQSGAVRKKRHSAPRRGAQRLRSAIATPGAGRWPSRRYRRARARRPTRLCARRPGGGWIPPGRARGRGAAATMGRERTSCPAARARRRKCLNPQTAKPGSLHATSFVKSALS